MTKKVGQVVSAQKEFSRDGLSRYCSPWRPTLPWYTLLILRALGSRSFLTHEVLPRCSAISSLSLSPLHKVIKCYNSEESLKILKLYSLPQVILILRLGVCRWHCLTKPLPKSLNLRSFFAFYSTRPLILLIGLYLEIFCYLWLHNVTLFLFTL